MEIKNMSEKQLREFKALWPKSKKELDKHISELLNRSHDYGTCVYAVSLAAVATFNYMSHELGITGFQASCADMDILRRTRCMERFRIIDLSNLLYPQYADKFKSYEEEIADNLDWLKEEAAEKLKANPVANPNVIIHWKRLAS
jgi:hypothetical protein